MVALIVTIVAVTMFVGVVVLWSRQRLRKVAHSPMIEAAVGGESVRVDLQLLRSIPSLAAAVDRVKWSKLQKQNGGRTDVGDS